MPDRAPVVREHQVCPSRTARLLRDDVPELLEPKEVGTGVDHAVSTGV